MRNIFGVSENPRMSKLFLNALRMSPVVLAATFSVANSAIAGEVTSVSQLADNSSQEMGQVTSVSQFSDVQPTDWAFQALQSLVERYGCIAGYPNGTYRGNRALTRYEFAAGLNACLDRVNELIATATADLVTKEDLATLQRLQEEFSAELATLRGRVDSLEARTAELEANQFSTTTKLKGEAIFALSSAFGDEKADGSGEDVEDNVTFSQRVRLNLFTSFTGTDRLHTRLQAGNMTRFRRNTSTPPVDNTTGTNMTRLGFDTNTENDFELDKLNYAFDLALVKVKIDATGGDLNDNVNVFNPLFKSSGSGALSRYGRFSPIYRQAFDGSGVTLTFNPNGRFTFDAAYYGRNADSPADGEGLFNGSNTAFAQIQFKPNKQVGVGLAYARTYQNSPGTQTINLLNSTGSAFAANPFDGDATVANNYGIQASFRPTDRIVVSGWAGLTNAESKSGATNGADADIFYWAANVGIRDFGAEGNVLGLIVGQSPRVTDNDVADREDNDTSFHLEGLYKMKLSDNIAITPGLLVIFNPEHNSDNDTVYVGTVRTTFKF